MESLLNPWWASMEIIHPATGTGSRRHLLIDIFMVCGILVVLRWGIWVGFDVFEVFDLEWVWIWVFNLKMDLEVDDCYFILTGKSTLPPIFCLSSFPSFLSPISLTQPLLHLSPVTTDGERQSQLEFFEFDVVGFRFWFEGFWCCDLWVLILNWVLDYEK